MTSANKQESPILPLEDAPAPDTLYRQHSHWLIAFLRRRFGRERAEDLAQETYLHALAAQAETIRNPRAFLKTVAINAARDEARRAAVRPTLAPEGAAYAHVSEPDDQVQALLLKQVILALPPQLQEVFLLSRYAGLTYDEIALRLGVSVKTVEGRMTKALARCMALMRD